MKKLPYSAIIPVHATAVSLREGMLLQAGGIPLLLRKLDAEGVLLLHQETGECKRVSEAQLLDAILLGQVLTEHQQQRGPHDLSAHVIDKAQIRGATERALEVWANQMAWLNALRAKGITRIVDEPWVRTTIAQLARSDLKGRQRFALSTLCEIDLKIRNAGGDVTVAVPKYADRGGRGKQRVDARVAEIMVNEIERIKNETKGPIVKKQIFQSIAALIECRNVAMPDDPIPTPGESTVSREIAKHIPAYEIVKRNRGERVANQKFREHAYARDTATWPLEVSEYDDADSRVFAVDERTGLPWGRIYLTNGVSQSTLQVLGYDIGDKPRSFESAIGAICHSLLPKEGCMPGEMGYGNQGQILLDNARYNESKAMKARSRGMSLLLSAARPYGPTEKNSIEHYNWMVKSDFCPTLPGWIGSKGDREAVDEGICAANMTLADFQSAYRFWVTKIYANKVGEDGWTPKQRWLKHYRTHGPAVRYSSSQLALFRLRPETLKFRASGGLMSLKLRYASPELAELRRRLGHEATVQVFIDSKDLTYLMVADPFTNALLRVPCSEDSRYVANLTAAQHRTILAMAYARGIKNPSLKDLWEARQELRRLVEQAGHSNRIRKRTWARKNAVGASPSAEVSSPPQPEPNTILVTELEYQINELQAITLTADDEW